MAYFLTNSTYHNNYIFVCDICTHKYTNNYFCNPTEILQLIKQYEIKKGDIYYRDIKYNMDWCSKCYKHHNFTINKQNHFIKKINN